MNRARPRVNIDTKDTSSVVGDDNPLGMVLSTKPRLPFAPRPIRSYIDGWWLRAGINLGKIPTEEEHNLEKMIFKCLWDMKVRAEREEQEILMETTP